MAVLEVTRPLRPGRRATNTGVHTSDEWPRLTAADESQTGRRLETLAATKYGRTNLPIVCGRLVPAACCHGCGISTVQTVPAPIGRARRQRGSAWGCWLRRYTPPGLSELVNTALDDRDMPLRSGQKVLGGFREVDGKP